MEVKTNIRLSNFKWRILSNKREGEAILEFKIIADRPIKSTELHEIVKEFRKVIEGDDSN